MHDLVSHARRVLQDRDMKVLRWISTTPAVWDGFGIRLGAWLLVALLACRSTNHQPTKSQKSRHGMPGTPAQATKLRENLAEMNSSRDNCK